ncbi:SDR family oxidoreductase [Pseudomonas sp. RIT-PI-AD]|uniref:SDR family oxidoreductase n=1 Tax=Pseudomonas sp. RIT-PI-AD TaxID=3035294 RepID=UPI0021DB10A2|nr:SDR family oxidoreductase [Pseudomonas sp. RIT-PI-AD]
MGRFSAKTVLITGGTSGMGLAGARRIVDEGGRVIVTGRDRSRLDRAREALGRAAVVLHCDSGNPDSAGVLAAEIRKRGGLDGLWLNAGLARIGPVEALTAEGFDALMAVNVRGPALQLAALSPLLNPGASVVVTSSSSAYESAPLVSVYAATKGALLSMARCWAASMAPRRIRVNSIVPGPIETSFRDFLDADVRQRFEHGVVEQVPLGRAGTADEAAAVALFLLSADATYVTGSQYAVDGGLLMR